MTASRPTRRTPSQHDGDYTRAAYRDAMIALFALLQRRGLSGEQIAAELRSAPVPTLDGPALELAEAFAQMQERRR